MVIMKKPLKHYLITLKNPNIIENYINAGIILADVGEIEKAERFFQKQ